MSNELITALQSAAGNAGSFYPYTVDYSARFNDNDSARMVRSPSVTGDRKKIIVQGWFKPTVNGTDQVIFSCGDTAAHFDPGGLGVRLAYQSNAQLSFLIDNTSTGKVITKAVLRDPSSWYHILLAVDTTQNTASNRVSIYINKEKVTDFDTANYPAQNLNFHMNEAGVDMVFGAFNDAGFAQYLDGYLSYWTVQDGETLFTDTSGTYDTNYVSADGSSLVEWVEEKNGIVIPKNCSGLTFGTNGGLYDFADSSALGNDVSGNNNDFTSSGLTSSDQVIDTPTNNFSVMNPLRSRTGVGSATFSNGNLQTTGYTTHAHSTFCVGDSLLWYFEVLIQTAGTSSAILGVRDTSDYAADAGTSSTLYSSTAKKVVNGSVSSYGSTFTAGDIIGVLIDPESSEVTFYKNGVSQGAISNSCENVIVQLDNSGNWVYVSNFGQDSSFAGNKTAQGNSDANGIGDFYYTVPTGALALCAANLPEPVIGPNSAVKAEDCFAVRIVEGTGAELVINDLDFQPDLVIGKNRDAADSWTWFDSVRGAAVYMTSDLSQTPITDSQSLKSFDANGITLGTSPAVNTSGETYVWYFFKITPGFFDIQGYTGNGSVLNVSHNLGVEPDMMIGVGYGINPRNFVVYCNSLPVADPETDYLLMDTNAAVADLNTVWNDTAPTSTEFTLGNNVNLNSNTYAGVMYLWANSDISKVFYYKGNGNADGPFVYAGNASDFVFYKRTDSTGNWVVQDTERSPYNNAQDFLYLNLSNAESGGSDLIDFLGTGFKVRNTFTVSNASGGDYIGLSIGQPVKYSNAR